eukprot:CAMPEP_0167777912 /NCGR_PEP_ID=MMETSP0111_2-20121227/3967_1 /TAXON_ID=91324 /ORGANISM="Lotharella globosa, Strain CCCM811" /LENGTH=1084 /DNA_ID=CAMNT_0007668169 /DNA_START=6 /DNA_END=3260 /DNA_ORIENTATION=-
MTNSLVPVRWTAVIVTAWIVLQTTLGLGGKPENTRPGPKSADVVEGTEWNHPVVPTLPDHSLAITSTPSPLKTRRIRKVAIIGAGGFVGSRLYDELKKDFSVTGFDREQKIPEREQIIVHKAAKDIETSVLQSYDAVVFLGGFTGRKACEAYPERVWEENIETPMNLARRMTKKQLLVFASTSAVTEGSGNIPATEEFPVQEHLLDKYAWSMYHREIEMRKLHQSSKNAPQMIATRFGTVAGHSAGQRVDMVHMALARSAYTTGVLTVTHGETERAFLSLEDLVRAYTYILKNPEKAKEFDIFNLKSFNSNIVAVATETASQTGARIVAKDAPGAPVTGFNLDATKFESTFGFQFVMSQHKTVEDIVGAIPESITAKGVHQVAKLHVGHEHHHDSVPCPVCGSHHLQEVLDLHHQPLANDFRPNASSALEAERYPLKLVRCKVCNHLYLSASVSRKTLFDKYLYKSGTSRTLQEYFAWLANKVAQQARPERRNSGKVLEIASNDGSQLDQFKKIGWDTYGVDPAANIVPESVEKGHKAVVGFWGMQSFDHLPPPAELDAIVAQNVFAHVPNPVDFLTACRDAMGEHTKLYIQTSQCQMHQKGQFDTAYHEHISFFTGHSFYKAAQLAGLYISNFELTPIHGTSCFVTFQRVNSERKIDVPSRGLQARLDQETNDGIPFDFFYTKYQARAHFTRDWINDQLSGLSRSGYQLGAYGAAAKGMVLLTFILEKPNRPWKLDFVLDDAPLKQNNYCPGTDIPVRATSSLTTLDNSKPLALVILAWNFWKEISQNIRKALRGRYEEVLIICPFPSARIIKLKIDDDNYEDVLVDIPYRPAGWPQPSVPENRRQVTMIAEYGNDEATMAHWIRHHAGVFDKAVLINRGSNDSSTAILRRDAPSNWRIVAPWFDTEAQMDSYENAYSEDWRMELTPSDFLVHPNLRAAAASMKVLDKAVYQFPHVEMIGDDQEPMKTFESLATQRSVYAASGIKEPRAHNFYMRTGRGTEDASAGASDWPDMGFVQRYEWTPWPQKMGAGSSHEVEIYRDQAISSAVKDDLKVVSTQCEDTQCRRLTKSYHEAVVPKNPVFA